VDAFDWFPINPRNKKVIFPILLAETGLKTDCAGVHLRFYQSYGLFANI
jgi:hypothetical protein